MKRKEDILDKAIREIAKEWAFMAYQQGWINKKAWEGEDDLAGSLKSYFGEVRSKLFK